MTSKRRAQKFHTDDASLESISRTARPIKSTTQIWVVMRHQYGISALVSETSFGGETSSSVAKCWLFSQAVVVIKQIWLTQLMETVL